MTPSITDFEKKHLRCVKRDYSSGVNGWWVIIVISILLLIGLAGDVFAATPMVENLKTPNGSPVLQSDVEVYNATEHQIQEYCESRYGSV